MPGPPVGIPGPNGTTIFVSAEEAAALTETPAPPTETPLSSQEVAYTAQMSRGPGGQPVFVEPGTGPLSENALEQGVGGPDGVRPWELIPQTTPDGVPLGITQAGLPPGVPDPRPALTSGVQDTSFRGGQQVTQGANGTATRPPLTEEQSALMTKQEKLAWDDPGVDDEAMVALMEQQARGMTRMGQTDAAAWNERAGVREAYEQQLNESAEDIRRSMEETINETRRMQDDMQARVDNLFSQRFDPRRIFSSPDAAASFSLHTGYAMGAMLQSLQATNFIGSNPVNVASRVIDGVIEADIARQREAFRRGEGELNQGFAAIEARRQLGVSEVEALEFSRAAAEDEVAQQLARISAQYQGTRAGQVYEQAATQYRLSAMGRRDQLNAAAQAITAARAQALTMQRGRGRQRRSESGDTGGLSYYMNEIPAERRTPRQQANYADYLALTPAQRNTVRARATAVGRALQLTDRLIHVLQTEGGAVQVDSAMRGRVAGLQAALTTAIKNAEELGALDNGVLDLVERLVGSHDDVFHLTNQDASRLMTYRNERRLELDIIAEETGQTTSQERLAQSNIPTSQDQLEGWTEPHEESSVTDTMEAPGRSSGQSIVDSVGSVVQSTVDAARTIAAPIVRDLGINVPERETVTPEQAMQHPRGRFM